MDMSKRNKKCIRAVWDSEMFANTPSVMAMMSIRQALLLLGDVSARQIFSEHLDLLQTHPDMDWESIAYFPNMARLE
ncbi:hypothetical protein FNV43_RR08680 [Rhamnella rubrinervis]|uniref:Uncharacterized protein n=1 Tax=Rhamnella rubrinervis TaxID=2594499 RepID=A0A8K0H9T7_9ROSA|nr:hypothetical protein FNV43_RR08680 [Rhamnella rubrinervis]